MKPVLPEKSTTKLPKRYWFILIFMCFIAILQLLHLSAYVYIKVNDFDKRDVVTLLLSIFIRPNPSRMFLFENNRPSKVLTFRPSLVRL